ncbi:hypothetical protein IIQ44_13690 [Acinetobacter oleivorans]|uniref:hypothetical protein n=1 Tax=Acinetobacter oleivorans TaxID=1148157 RepID=UPI00178C99FE|nr:hypothetical protein [Acinetobacter oleivorans]MBE2172949.1 hypothetical protein [Acinetobacter oleivorans]
MQVCFKKLLEEIDDCNEIIYGERFLINQVNSVNDDLFKSYLSCIPENDFNIDLGGNINDFLGKDSLDNIQYMFEYILDGGSATVFLTQHDVNIVYINHNSGEIGACISGDELHIIAKNLFDFFSQINIVQNLIIDLYDSNPRGENGGYKTGFLEELKKILINEKVLLDVEYFIEFFYS